MFDIIIVLFDMTLLIYNIHWIICFMNIHNKMFYFSSIIYAIRMMLQHMMNLK